MTVVENKNPYIKKEAVYDGVPLGFNIDTNGKVDNPNYAVYHSGDYVYIKLYNPKNDEGDTIFSYPYFAVMLETFAGFIYRPKISEIGFIDNNPRNINWYNLDIRILRSTTNKPSKASRKYPFKREAIQDAYRLILSNRSIDEVKEQCARRGAIPFESLKSLVYDNLYSPIRTGLNVAKMKERIKELGL